jgi:hypothetical protein
MKIAAGRVAELCSAARTTQGDFPLQLLPHSRPKGRVSKTKLETLPTKKGEHEMSLYKTVTRSDFENAFRVLRPNDFTTEALEHLYEYLDELSDELEEMIELDVIAICCDYSESDVSEVLESYNLEDITQLEEKTVIVFHDEQKERVTYLNF